MPFYEGDGMEVDVELGFGSSQAVAITKALSDESERQVNDIMVLLFPLERVDASGNPVFSTTKPAIKKYFSVEEVQKTYAQPLHYNAGLLTFEKVPTGTYVIVGVSNVKTSEYGAESLYEALLNVTSWADYNTLHANLSTRGSIDRIAPSLLMSGSYRPNDYQGDHRKLTPVEIRATGILPGYIHLVRVDARVKFIITNSVQRVKSFKLESWQVFNVPDDVMVYTNSESTPNTVSNSTVFTQFTSRDTEHSFEFYIPEYVFTSTDPSLDLIRKREKRTDADDAWMYAPEDSPYIVFTGKIEMLVDDAETGEKDVNRYANVRYTVHLGACDGASEAVKAKDFKTDRNTKYTYNVRINGVNDIVVEAKRTPDVEYNHGSEGVVIDNVGGVTYSFDSHYGIANIALSRNDLRKMSISLSSVLGEQSFIRDNDGEVITSNINTTTEDFQAFRFAFEPVSSELAYKNYPPQIFTERYVSYSKTYDAGKYIEVQHNETSQAKDANHTFALYDLMSMLECLPFGDGEARYADQALISHLDAAMASPENRYASKDDIPVIFTMFVNENVYYEGVEDWHHHANSVDRLLRMFTTSDISSDGKSEYIRGRYNFDQKYCQTYYSDLNNEALCVEFVNEHHHKDIKNTKGVNPGSGKSVKSGWQYVNRELQGKAWDDCSDQTIPLCEHYNAFRTLYAVNGVYAKGIPGSSDPNDYEAIYASLSRNRDLNRDGIINSNEIKWFLPSMEQYIQITIGGAALEKKIFTPDDYYNWDRERDGNPGDIFGNVRFHFCGVETNSKLWAEEGYTVGDQSVSGAAESSSGWRSNPWEILCCRMLVDHSRVHEEEVHWNDFEDLYYWSNQEKNVISMDKYRSNLHRQEITSWIDLHSNDNDAANSTFTHFQFAKADAALVDRNPGELTLVERMHLNSYCASYYQEPDASDRGTWRTPNQRETAVMRYYADINNTIQPNSGAYYLSCSTWPFPSSGQRTHQGYRETIDFCTVGMNPTKSSPNGQLSQNYLRVRCVRDTDADGNFVGSPEFGNPINFQPGDFGCVYNGNLANYTVGAIMDADLVTSVSVTIDGYDAATTGIASTVSNVAGADVHKAEVLVVWTIQTTYGKTLTYRQPYKLPARYWMISRYSVDSRYATVDQNTNRTKIGVNDYRDVDEIEAIYKWIITKDPAGTQPVNESNLVVGTTYYVFNAGTEQYISGPTSGSQSYMVVGGTPMTMKLQERSGYNGYYVLRFNNSTNANSNGGVNNFGTWTGVDDGSTYKLTPAVLRGEMPFNFSAGQFTTDYSQTDGTLATYTFDATFASGTAQLVSVTVNGNAVSSPAVSGDNIHCVMSDALIPENGQALVRWTFNKGGETIIKEQNYELPVKFYLIKSILSSASYGYQYAYVDASGNTRSVALTADMDKSRAEMKFRWVLSGDTASSSRNILASEVVTNGNRSLYLYNQAAGAYITKPSPVVNFTDYLPTGATAHRFCFDASKNGGFRPYFKWDGTNTYGSCANSSRNPDKNKFGFSQAGVDAAYWIFVPVYRDNGPETPLTFEFGGISETAGTYSVSATMDQDASIVSVTFDGVAASFTKSGTAASASLPSTSLTNPYGFTATWTVSKGGQTYVKSKYYVAKNTPYWAFRHSDGSPRPYVYADNGIVKFRSESTPPADESRWVLQEKVSGAFVTSYNSASSYSDISSTQYVLFNIGTGMYLGPQNSDNIMTVVSGKENAQAFVIRFNGNHECIHFINPNGSHKGWAFRNDGDATVRLQVAGSPSHGWKLWYPDHN